MLVAAQDCHIIKHKPLKIMASIAACVSSPTFVSLLVLHPCCFHLQKSGPFQHNLALIAYRILHDA